MHESDIGVVRHGLRDGMQKMFEADLSPWNHAPCQLDEADYRALSRRYLQTLRAKHASIVDALSGKRLDVFDQCVPIEVAAASGAPPMDADDALAEMKDVAGLYAFLQVELFWLLLLPHEEHLMETDQQLMATDGD